MTTEELLALIPANVTDPDLRQDIAVALLEAQPDSVKDALLLIARVRYRKDWHDAKERKLFKTQATEPDFSTWTPVQTAAFVKLYAAFDSLDRMEQSLVQMRLVSRQSAAATASAHGISQPTMRKRLDIAVEKLRDRLSESPVLDCVESEGVSSATSPASRIEDPARATRQPAAQAGNEETSNA